jgi:hypothetical protein
MAIATGLAIAAGVGALGSVAGGAMAASGAKKAAKTAAATEAANQARLAEVYAQNTRNIDPFMQRGNAAGDAYNALLGLPTYQAPQQPANMNMGANAFMGGGFPGDPFRGIQRQPGNETQVPAGTVQSGMTPQGAMDGFRSYIDNSDYAFRQNEGNRGINAGYAANGLLESGAAMKALEKYRGNLNAGYRNEYLGHLGNQQGVGLSGANALAGVSTNYANNANANADSGASARINSGLIGSSAMGQGLAGAAQGIGSALGSSYGGPNTGATFNGYNYGNAGNSLLSYNAGSASPWG